MNAEQWSKNSSLACIKIDKIILSSKYFPQARGVLVYVKRVKICHNGHINLCKHLLQILENTLKQKCCQNFHNTACQFFDFQVIIVLQLWNIFGDKFLFIFIFKSQMQKYCQKLLSKNYCPTHADSYYVGLLFFPPLTLSFGKNKKRINASIAQQASYKIELEQCYLSFYFWSYYNFVLK